MSDRVERRKVGEITLNGVTADIYFKAEKKKYENADREFWQIRTDYEFGGVPRVSWGDNVELDELDPTTPDGLAYAVWRAVTDGLMRRDLYENYVKPSNHSPAGAM